MKTKAQKPHKWRRKVDASACVECGKYFVRGDMVYTDVAVNIHVDCLSEYRRTRLKLSGRAT